MDLKKFIGESTEYDKKQAVEMKKPKSWLKSVSAFANTVGGVLVFGVTDDEQVIGLDDIKSASEYVSQKVKERISPSPQIVMQLHTVEDGKDILTVRVPAGTDTPYYYAADGVTEAYIRIGNESVLADSTELKRLVLRGNNSSYDALISPYDYEDYFFSKLRERYKSWTGNSMTEKLMDSFGVRDASGKLTNAANYEPDLTPKFFSNRVCFIVTLWNLNFKASQDEALNEAINEALKPEALDLIALMKSDPTVTQAAMIQTLGLSRSKVQRVIKALTDDGHIKREGSKKTGRWVVLKEV